MSGISSCPKMFETSSRRSGKFVARTALADGRQFGFGCVIANTASRRAGNGLQSSVSGAASKVVRGLRSCSNRCTRSIVVLAGQKSSATIRPKLKMSDLKPTSPRLPAASCSGEGMTRCPQLLILVRHGHGALLEIVGHTRGLWPVQSLPP